MSQVPAPPYTRSDTLDFAVAGVGASAGGLNALIQLFEAMPHDADIAFVVVVHLSPEHVSRVPELLQKATRMPVREVVEAVAIKPNHVYVIPPNRVLRMHDGKLEAVPRRSRSMTIDLFLETLSEVHAHRGIGIILSGTGSDGTLGTRAVKAHGGVTFAQAPEEAEFDAMPRNAIGSGTVDFVLPVREIPAKLVSLWRNARAIRMPKIEDRPTAEDAAAEAEEAVRDIIATVRARTGHDFSQYKRTTLLRRFERRLQVNQLRDLSSYRELLTAQPGESRSLLRDLLISVTSFFRDANAFAAIEKQIVPALFARNENEPIRIWVVGCATGEEVYSLVMLLSE
ncbi:MAG TPA: chemotaxis protein CheB, partial [Casimicrobiaceae bacterium]|nr:chemotaxis protein CheB [Casimicrobiaceae bacterium]